jgi:hypothetical protein
VAGELFIAMKVLLGPLARSGLETRAGSNLPVAVNAALDYYVDRMNSDRPPAPVPDFLVAHGKQVEVPVDGRIEAALAANAEDQGIGLPELSGHAIFVYLAELTRARYRAA